MYIDSETSHALYNFIQRYIGYLPEDDSFLTAQKENLTQLKQLIDALPNADSHQIDTLFTILIPELFSALHYYYQNQPIVIAEKYAVPIRNEDHSTQAVNALLNPELQAKLSYMRRLVNTELKRQRQSLPKKTEKKSFEFTENNRARSLLDIIVRKQISSPKIQNTLRIFELLSGYALYQSYLIQCAMTENLTAMNPGPEKAMLERKLEHYLCDELPLNKEIFFHFLYSLKESKTTYGFLLPIQREPLIILNRGIINEIATAQTQGPFFGTQHSVSELLLLLMGLETKVETNCAFLQKIKREISKMDEGYQSQPDSTRNSPNAITSAVNSLSTMPEKASADAASPCLFPKASRKETENTIAPRQTGQISRSHSL